MEPVVGTVPRLASLELSVLYWSGDRSGSGGRKGSAGSLCSATLSVDRSERMLALERRRRSLKNAGMVGDGSR